MSFFHNPVSYTHLFLAVLRSLVLTLGCQTCQSFFYLLCYIFFANLLLDNRLLEAILIIILLVVVIIIALSLALTLRTGMVATTFTGLSIGSRSSKVGSCHIVDLSLIHISKGETPFVVNPLSHTIKQSTNLQSLQQFRWQLPSAYYRCLLLFHNPDRHRSLHWLCLLYTSRCV